MSFNEVNQVTGELNQAAGSFSDMVYADAPVGAIQAFGGSTVPLGWLMCDGSAVSRTTYAALFAVIGTRYGSGDGSTSFNLPSREAGAAVYPSADGNVLSESNYIIKAIKTAVPADIQSELDLKQDITDNTLQTTSKTVSGAINEVKDKLDDAAIKNEVNRFSKNIYLEGSSSNDVNLHAKDGVNEIGQLRNIAEWGMSQISFLDKNEQRIAFMQPLFTKDGSVDVYLNIDSSVNPNGNVWCGSGIANPCTLHTIPATGTWGDALINVRDILRANGSQVGRLILELGGAFYHSVVGTSLFVCVMEENSEFAIYFANVDGAFVHKYYSSGGTMHYTDFTASACSGGHLYVI